MTTPFRNDDVERFVDWDTDTVEVRAPDGTGPMTAEQFQDWWTVIELAGTDRKRLEVVARQIAQLRASPRRNDLLATIEQILDEL